MPDPIKTQILARLATDLAAAGPGFRKIQRGLPINPRKGPFPAAYLIEKDETTIKLDGTTLHQQFNIHIIIHFQDHRDPPKAKDLLVAETQSNIEGDTGLGGLGEIINSGEDVPEFAQQPGDNLHRTTLTFTIRYTRKLGDPYLAS
jgi:hypothetical protein